ncbi:MAG TPA: hypothetical protein VFV55_05550, partial [Usitatibacteraceae bacterium]|nr:hypothetical protein [Usitatibacteraceae bacterium]
AVHIGDARVRRFGSPSTVEITRARQEVYQDDRLVPAREASFPSYMPHAPDKAIKGVILSVRGSVSEIAQFSIVTINRGSRDGVEVGHVLATMRRGDQLIRNTRPPLSADFFGSGTKSVATKPNPVVPDAIVASADGTAPATYRPDQAVILPDERSGLLFVFRVFEKLSYGIIMKSVRPISVGDVVQTP